MTNTENAETFHRTTGCIKISKPDAKKTPNINSGKGCAGADHGMELIDLGKEHPQQESEQELAKPLVQDEAHPEPNRAEKPYIKQDEQKKTKKSWIYWIYVLAVLVILFAGVILAGWIVLVGHSQCQYPSDEWDYAQLDPEGILRFGHNSSSALFVCGDGWNHIRTDLVCGELGYFGGTNFTFISDNKRSEGYCMYQVQEKDRLTFELIDSAQCNEGILKLQCQEYNCGREADKSTIDERYEDSDISAYTICSSLALAFSNNAAIKCTANIVSPRWALTSYTCIKDKAEFEDDMKWKLFAGLIKFAASEEQRPTPHIDDAPQIVDIKRVVPYPKNKQSMYYDDVVLLELATPLKFNDIIGSVCLAETFSTIYPKQRCLTTGWESYFEDTAITEQYMTNVSAVNVHTGRCNSFKGELPNNTICVEPLISSQTTCYDDEGAPLMCYVAGTGQWQLQGVLSNNGNCDNGPAIYNSITPAIATWIRYTVGNGRMFKQNNVNDKNSSNRPL